MTKKIVLIAVLVCTFGLAACQADPQPTATPQPSTAASPSPVKKSLELPKTVAGLSRLEVKDSDWGMALSLKPAFPQATVVAGAGFSTPKKVALIVGVVITDTTDAKAAIGKAFQSMAPGPGHASVGLGMPKTHAVNGGVVGGTILCGLSDGGGTNFPVCAWAHKGVVGLVAYMGDTDPKYVEQNIHAVRADVEKAVRDAGLTAA